MYKLLTTFVSTQLATKLTQSSIHSTLLDSWLIFTLTSTAVGKINLCHKLTQYCDSNPSLLLLAHAHWICFMNYFLYKKKSCVFIHHVVPLDLHKLHIVCMSMAFHRGTSGIPFISCGVSFFPSASSLTVSACLSERCQTLCPLVKVTCLRTDRRVSCSFLCDSPLQRSSSPYALRKSLLKAGYRMGLSAELKQPIHRIMELSVLGGLVVFFMAMQVKKVKQGNQQMTKAPSTAARVTVALCSRAMAAVDAVRAKDGVAARIRRTLKRSVEERLERQKMRLVYSFI